MTAMRMWTAHFAVVPLCTPGPGSLIHSCHSASAALPDMSDHPLMWSEKEIESLKGSPMLSRLRVRLQNIEDDVRELIDSGANDISVGGKTGLVTIESVRWVSLLRVSPALPGSYHPEAE